MGLSRRPLTLSNNLKTKGTQTGGEGSSRDFLKIINRGQESLDDEETESMCLCLHLILGS